MSEDKKKITMLLVGASMAGKSEFILSYINSEDRKRIPASGKGQTTRTSMIYSIDCINKKQLSIKLILKKKEIFCAERISSFWEKFDFDNRTNQRKQRGFKHALIEDNAFFHHNEFKCSETISNKYDELLNNDFYNAITKTKTDNDEEKYGVQRTACEGFSKIYDNKTTNECDNIELDECLKIFIGWVFDECQKEIENYLMENLKLENINSGSPIDISSVEDIGLFLKTQEKEVSYSSLVDKIEIETFIADYYYELMNELRIGKIQFVDTYGLDHDKVADADLVKKRYHALFKEFPSIENVIYIRRAIDGPPTDLSQNVPLLYSVKPSVMSYVCFTHVDMLDNDTNDTKAVKAMRDADSSVYDEVSDKLLEAGVNEKMAELRITSMAKNIVMYCSKVGVDSKYRDYLENNVNQIKQLLLYIRDKKHLGDLCIDINKMLSIEKIGKIIDVCSVFSSHEDFQGYPGRTMGALGDRIQSGQLGFYSRTWDYFKYWDDEIYALVKNRFFNITKLYKWSEYLGNENVIPVIQGLFNEFMNLSIRCKIRPETNINNRPLSDICRNCAYKEDCIQNVIYEAKKEIINSKYYPVHSWLTSIYNFQSLLNNGDTRNKLQNIFNQLYKNCFIALCRENNARVLASELSLECTENEIDKQLQRYFSEMDSELSDEEKIEFEQKVNQFLQ